MLTPSPGQVFGLLRAIGAKLAGPASPPQPAATKPAGPSEGEFADLLRRAASGELVSGVPVTVDRDAGVSLSEDQLARLSLAADRAEAEGIHNAVVMIDGMSLLLDVKTRTVTKQVDLSQGVLRGIDGVVTVGAAGEGAPTAAEVLPPLPPGGLAQNASVLDLLAAKEPQQRPSAA